MILKNFRTPQIAAALLLALAPAAVPAQTGAAAHRSDRNAYVYFEPGTRSSMMSGSSDDYRRAEALRSGQEGLLYLRQDGSAYVIRDAATIRQADAIFEPQRRLGAQQGALGARQGALGAQQGRLGAEQGRLGARQASVTPATARALGRQQSELGRQQHALGQQQHVLGQQQAELGRQQHEAARAAEGRLRALLSEAIQRGTAQRVD